MDTWVIKRISRQELDAFAWFVIGQYYTQHSAEGPPHEKIEQDARYILREDAALFEDSIFYAAYKGVEMVGTVKVTRWHQGMSLPIETMFDISIPQLLEQQSARSAWQVGRFAIARGCKDGAVLLKNLINRAIMPICEHADSIMIAECDAKFVRGLNSMGIQTEVLAPGISYLGSETVPIYTTNERLSAFLKNSKYFDGRTRDLSRGIAPVVQ